MKAIFTFFTLSFIALLFVQCNTTDEIIKLPNGVEMKINEVILKVEFYTSNTVRVTKVPKESSMDRPSLSVIASPDPSIKIELSEDETHVILNSSVLQVKIAKVDGQIQYNSSTQTTLLKEDGNQFKRLILPNDSGFNIQQNYKLTADEGIYGLGQHQNGYLNYRNKTVTLVQTNTDAVNPFLVSTNNYGILWDNYSKTIFESNNNEASLWSKLGDGIDYYFVAGDNMDEVISGYRHLTGKAPMYGKWAYGYWQSKEHYENRAELLGVAKEYRKRNIPIDNMVQDWDTWEGAENWNQLFFDPVKFPEPKEMLDILHKDNFHVMISVWCSFGLNTPVYKEMNRKDFLLPTVGWAKFKYFDPYNPKATSLYWDYLNKGFFSIGMDAWWMDSTEPDVINAITKGATEYELERMPNNYLGSFTRYLNPYTLLATESVYENQRKTSEKQRAYILTRSTFAGQQRAAATTWSGDIGASWPVYKNQITAGLNHSMSGIPYWTFDIGAFVLGGYGGVFNKGVNDPAYQELYTRMFQFGAFCPIFRSHGSEVSREMWHFGDFSPILIKFDKLRYRLMPYIYSVAGDITHKDYTPMRALPMDFASDKNTLNVDDQYMFGPSIMVCPVTEYMLHKPPMKSTLLTPNHFKTLGGKPGLEATYYKDTTFHQLGLATVDSCINLNWYSTGRPDYVTDSTLSIKWKGILTPTETGMHQFNVKCYGPKTLRINGKILEDVYQGVEAYSKPIYLKAGKAYEIELEKKNGNPGAFHVELYWKTPAIFAQEKVTEKREKTRNVYLPEGTNWVDFWTGKSYKGGQTIVADAPIDKIPLLIKAGSILPMGPFVQYATEKKPDPLEIRIYKGANGKFKLYEDENDNYNYEKGAFSTIPFTWNDKNATLSIGARQGSFPGMLEFRTFQIVLVDTDNGTGIELASDKNKTISYVGDSVKLELRD